MFLQKDDTKKDLEVDTKDEPKEFRWLTLKNESKKILVMTLRMNLRKSRWWHLRVTLRKFQWLTLKDEPKKVPIVTLRKSSKTWFFLPPMNTDSISLHKMDEQTWMQVLNVADSLLAHRESPEGRAEAAWAFRDLFFGGSGEQLFCIPLGLSRFVYLMLTMESRNNGVRTDGQYCNFAWKEREIVHIRSFWRCSSKNPIAAKSSSR